MASSSSRSSRGLRTAVGLVRRVDRSTAARIGAAHRVLKIRSGVETAARASRVQRDRSRTARLLGQSVALHLKTGFMTACKQIQGPTRGTRSPSTRPGPRHRLFLRAHATNTSKLCWSKATFGPALRSLSRRSATVVEGAVTTRRALRAVFPRPPSSSTVARRSTRQERRQALALAYGAAAARASDVVRIADTRSKQTT